MSFSIRLCTQRIGMRFEGYFFLIFFLGMVMPFAQAAKSESVPDAAQLEEMSSRFAPTPLRVDISKLSGGDRQALVKMLDAARILNTIFMKQYWSGNPALFDRLQKDGTPLGKARLHYFWLNKGPWSALDGFHSFSYRVTQVKNNIIIFYPKDMNTTDFENLLTSLSNNDQKQTRGFF